MNQVSPEKVIEKLANRIATLEADRAVLMVQVEQLQQENETLKKREEK